MPASAQAAGYQDAVLASDPLTYLRLDEPLGSAVAQDASRTTATASSPAA